MSYLCSICLNPGSKVTNFEENNPTKLDVLTKLQKCVPEVEWKNDTQICPQCSLELENVYLFREKCIQSYLSRKNAELELDACPETRSDSEDEKPPDFVCFQCDDKFPSKTLLEKHIKTAHSKKVPCDICNKLLSESGLKRHKTICGKRQKPEPEPCNICDMCAATFSNKYLLKRHIKNVHATEKKFKCEMCERRFASPVYLNAHKRYHFGERRHICSFCGKGYITASDLYHHEKIHANKRAYQCPLCPKAFNTSSDLHKHKICVHQDRTLWKYECSFCQRRFPLKTNLDTHTKTHTGERNFLCHLCDRKCINRSVLKRHIGSHSVAKTFKCSLCLQGYKYQKSLDIHMVKVHGIGDAKVPERVKKYFCSICPKSYFANNKLQKHIRSHTGERPFGCPACDKCFIDKSYIKQHLKTAHNIL